MSARKSKALTLSKAGVNNALKKLSGIPVNKTLPILNSIKIKLEDSVLSFSGTDLDIEGEVFMEVENDESFEVLVPSKFLNIIKLLPDDITLQVNGDKLKIKSGKSKFTLPILNSDDYPSVKFEGKLVAKIKESLLKKMINNVRYATMKEREGKYSILEGVNFNTKTRNIDIVASDGHRLSLTRLKNSGIPDDVDITIRKRGINELLKFLDSSDSEVEIYVDNHSILFKTENWRYWTRSLEGEFVNYPSVIESQLPSLESESNQIIADKTALMETIRRVAVVGYEENSHTSPMVIGIENGKLVIQAHNEGYYAREELEIESESYIEGSDVGVNGEYLIDLLKNLNADKVKILFLNRNLPIVVYPYESDLEFEFIGLVMPMEVYI